MGRLTKPWSQAICDYIDRFIEADFETGLLYWKESRPWRNIQKGDQRKTSFSGYHPRRYACFGVSVKGEFKILKVHQVIFYLYHKRQALLFINHIDNNPLNNAISNLEEVSISKNRHNPNDNHKKRSLLPGVYIGKRRKGKEYFYSRIILHGQKYHLGIHSTEQEAHEAYMTAKRNITATGHI
ncbi:TPA: endonuclease [Escherichia coli]|nr:endonuclease [Escherichia coli]